MPPSFEEALETLIDQYRVEHSTPLEDLISALELKLMALQEEADQYGAASAKAD